MLGRLFQRGFHILLLARDTWITAAIVAVAMILIPQGQQILAKVAAESFDIGSFAGTTFWSLAAYFFTRVRYRHAIEQHHRDAITPRQAQIMAAVAGLIPIAITAIGIHAVLPSGATGLSEIIVPALSLIAFVGVVVASRAIAARRADETAGQRRSTVSESVLIALFLLPGLVLFILGYVLPVPTAHALETYPLITIWAGGAVAFLGCLQILSGRVGLPLTGILIVVALVFSAVVPSWHQGHELRALDSELAPDQRVSLRDALGVWLEAQQDNEPITLTLVAAPGGGIISAVWTSVALSKIHEIHGDNFARSLFAISAVSGGSLGATLFAESARTDIDACLHLPSGELDANGLPLSKMQRAVGAFSRIDHIAAVAMRLLYLNDTLSPYIAAGPYSDRSEVIERSWEGAWHSAVAAQGCRLGDSPVLAESYLDRWYDVGDNGAMVLTQTWADIPFLMFGGTSMASGRRLVTSPFVFPLEPDIAGADRSDTGPGDADSMALDLLTLSGNDHRMSTAVNSSARFPWIEPAGRVTVAEPDDERYTYDLIVDGGYSEPSGAATLSDLVADIIDVCAASPCPPLRLMVIQIDSHPVSAPASYAPRVPPRDDPPRLWHELLTPFYAGYVADLSHGQEAIQKLRDKVETLPLLPDVPFVETLFVELPVTTHSGPDAWVLSGDTLDTIMRDANLSMHCAQTPGDAICQSEMAAIAQASTLVGPVPGHVQDLRRKVLHESIQCIGVFLARDASADCRITRRLE